MLVVTLAGKNTNRVDALEGENRRLREEINDLRNEQKKSAGHATPGQPPAD